MDYESAKRAIDLLVPRYFHDRAFSSIVGFGIGNKIIDGVDTGVLCARVYVSKKLEPADLAPAGLVPAEVVGVPIDVVEVNNRFRPDGHLPDAKGETNGGITLGTVKPGASIAPDTKNLPNVNQGAAGTLGAILKDAKGGRYLLSCNHVLSSKGRVPFGQTVFSPAPIDSDGNEYPVAKFVGAHPIKRVQALIDEDNIVDCALAKLSSDFRGKIDPAFKSISNIAETAAEPKLGQPVVKIGKTTGRTTGRIVDVDADILVDYGFGEFRFRHQILIEGDTSQFAAKGDSGSVVLAEPDKDEPRHRAVGLIHAPAGKLVAACRMTDVLKLLGEIRDENGKQVVSGPLTLLTRN